MPAEPARPGLPPGCAVPRARGAAEAATLADGDVVRRGRRGASTPNDQSVDPHCGASERPFRRDPRSAAHPSTPDGPPLHRPAAGPTARPPRRVRGGEAAHAPPGDRSDGGRRDLRRTTSRVTSSTVEPRGSSGGCWRHRLPLRGFRDIGFWGEEHGGDDTLLVVRPSGRVAEPLSRAQGMGVMLALIEHGQPVQCVIHLPPAAPTPRFSGAAPGARRSMPTAGGRPDEAGQRFANRVDPSAP
jgi:hypothetical protein